MFKELFDFAKEIVIENPAKLTVAIPAYIIGTKLRQAPLLTKATFVIAAGIVGGGAGLIDGTLEAKRNQILYPDAL